MIGINDTVPGVDYYEPVIAHAVTIGAEAAAAAVVAATAVPVCGDRAFIRGGVGGDYNNRRTKETGLREPRQ